MEKPPGRVIHYTQLPDKPPNHPTEREWNFFRRELPRLLAEGHEGKWALLKGEEIVGLYATDREAVQAGYAKFLLEQFLVHQIRTWEPLLLTAWSFWPCRT
jgi:hypothetical protein